MEISTQLAYENQEIISLIKENKPDLVAIDAPLSLPLDRSGNKN